MKTSIVAQINVKFAILRDEVKMCVSVNVWVSVFFPEFSLTHLRKMSKAKTVNFQISMMI